MEGIKCYGILTNTEVRLNMCGGCAEWWNYILRFKNQDLYLYKESSKGEEYIARNPPIYWSADDEEVFLDLEDELDKSVVSELFIMDYEFFFGCGA